jgi:integrase
MSDVKFTDRELHKLVVPKGAKQRVVADTQRSGASFRKQKSGAWAYTFSGWQKNGERLNVTLAALTVAEAREEAAMLRARIRRGEDVRGALIAEKAEARVTSEAAKEAARLETPAGKLAAAKAKREADEARFTLRKMLRRYDFEHLSTLRLSYARRAERDISRALSDLTDVDANEITKAQVRERINASGTAGTRRFLASVICAMFRFGARHDWLKDNVLRDFPMPPAPPPRTRTLTLAESRIVYAAAGALSYPEGPFFRMLLLTAARRGEIAGLRWDELQEDEDGPIALIPASRTKTGRTSMSDHRIPLSPEAMRVLDAVERAGGRIVGSPFVFSFDGSKPLGHFARLKQRLDAEVKKLADLPAYKAHDFRRSCITALAARGHDSLAIDLLLGHVGRGLSDVARIYNRYAHGDARRKALTEWAELLAAPPDVDNVRRIKRRAIAG